MFLKIRSALVFLSLVVKVTLQNISHELSENACEGGSKAFSARVWYDYERSESASTFNGCVTGSNITAIELLSRVSTIEANTFVNMPKLNFLNMKNRGISILKPGFVKNTPHLEKVFANENELDFIPKDAFNHLNLYVLWLNSNEISFIETGAFANFTTRWLSLSKNKLNRIDSSWFHESRIGNIDLNFNQITNLYTDTFKGIKGLQSLYLNGNKIYFIEDNTFSGIKSLRKLYLARNALNNINFLNDTRIKFINLSFNVISSMEMNESIKIGEIMIYPNPWNCKCLRKFWKYAWEHEINYSDARLSNAESTLLCVVHGDNCDSNYSDPVVLGKYFKFVNYALIF